MWFDHTIWYMVNHLSVFFNDENFMSLPAKFKAFLAWISEAARVAVRHHVTFNYTRELIVEVVVQYSNDFEAKLLAEHPNARVFAL